MRHLQMSFNITNWYPACIPAWKSCYCSKIQVRDIWKHWNCYITYMVINLLERNLPCLWCGDKDSEMVLRRVFTIRLQNKVNQGMWFRIEAVLLSPVLCERCSFDGGSAKPFGSGSGCKGCLKTPFRNQLSSHNRVKHNTLTRGCPFSDDTL